MLEQTTDRRWLLINFTKKVVPSFGMSKTEAACAPSSNVPGNAFKLVSYLCLQLSYIEPVHAWGCGLWLGCGSRQRWCVCQRVWWRESPRLWPACSAFGRLTLPTFAIAGCWFGCHFLSHITKAISANLLGLPLQLQVQLLNVWIILLKNDFLDFPR